MHGIGDQSSKRKHGHTDSSMNKPPKIQKKEVEIEMPKSIFGLDSPESHRAIPLANQIAFRDAQQAVIEIARKFIGNPRLKSNLEERRKIYVLNDDEIKDIEYVDQCNKILALLKDPQITDEYDLNGNIGAIQIGVKPSSKLHKDNGEDFKGKTADYTLVIPLLDYDLSGKGEHNLSPQSTEIVPMAFKDKIPGYNQPKINRTTVFLGKKTSDIQQYLVSDRLTEGTVIVLRTVTEPGKDDDGKSVIHTSPETPEGYARCFLIIRGNKKQKYDNIDAIKALKVGV